jgi:Cu-Zn family superoxide dismutase
MTDLHHDTRPRSGWHAALVAVIAAALALAVGPAIAQEASPAPPDAEALRVTLLNVDGEEVGVASFVQVEGLDAVRITVEVEGLEPGDHGIHIHETGTCDPAAAEGPFSSAGGHFNPTGASHGPGPGMMAMPDATPMAGEPRGHAGDLGNITVGEDGTGVFEITSDRITLLPDTENSLADADGSALVIHENPDDLATDPSGESGGRIACGVIFGPMGGTPVAIRGN